MPDGRRDRRFDRPMKRAVRVAAWISMLAALGSMVTAAAQPLFTMAQPGPLECAGVLYRIELDLARPPAGQPHETPYDLYALDMMIDQATVVLQLANLGLSYATDSRTWRIALRIAESQAGELQLLHGWRSTWYPDIAPQNPDRPASSPVAATPSSTGSPTACLSQDFDRQFLRQMVALYEQAIERSTEAATRVEHIALGDFARTNAVSQQRELTVMQSLLDALPLS